MLSASNGTKRIAAGGTGGARRVLVFAGVAVASACGGPAVSHKPDTRALAAIAPETAFEAVAKKRIYFGHQSVGYNIVEGLEAWAKDRPSLGLKIVETRAPEKLEGAMFAHAVNGSNYDPLQKIADFARTIEGGIGDKADVAFFKFCYVDFEADTDVDQVFTKYKTTLADLRRRYSKTRFLHVTVPLTTVASGPKATVRKLLGRKIWQADANVVRDRFNELMRREYAGREPLFDLAAIESTRPDGSTLRYDHAGASYPKLVDEYASDGKHLNPEGSRWVAAHLIKTLATL